MAAVKLHLLHYLDLVMSLREFLLQALDFGTQLVDQLDLGVHILRGFVRDKTSLHSVVERADVLFDVLVRRREARHHQRVGVASERLLEQGCQL